MDIKDKCKDQCRVKNLLLDHETPGLFVQPQCGPNWFYLTWIVLWTIYHFVLLMLECYWDWKELGHHTPLWLTYLTNWSYTLLTTMIVVDLLTVVYAHVRRKELLDQDTRGKDQKMSWYLKISWVLFNIATTAAIMVTFFYWLYWLTLDTGTDFRDINAHAVNAVFCVLHLLVSAKPIRYLHFYQPIIYFLIYTVFSVIYQYASGGKLIYPVLDWEDTGKTILVTFLLIFLGTPGAFWVLCTLAQCKAWVASKCCGIPRVKNDTSSNTIDTIA